jgi:hypothetical protein
MAGLSRTQQYSSAAVAWVDAAQAAECRNTASATFIGSTPLAAIAVVQNQCASASASALPPTKPHSAPLHSAMVSHFLL